MNTQPGLQDSPHHDMTTTPGPAVGDVIGAYRLVRLLGEGSAGRVFEVEHIKIGRRAAMKVLAPDHANRPGSIRRLFQEAKAVNRINHPHIVDVTDLIEAPQPGGINAIVMELLEGRSLAQAMLVEGRMPAMRIVTILGQVADALAAAHGAYFIHRDLKPDNIFLVRRGRQQDVAKVLDFGLAKSFGSAAEGTASHNSYHTVEGTFVGTPAYTSPEQASAKSVDQRTDIYSLGVILYELLSGRLPFEGRNFGEFLVKHLTMPVPDIPPERCRTPLEATLAAVAYKCLEKNPADRFGSAGDLKDVFDRLRRGETVDVPVVRPAKPSLSPARRRWVTGLVVGVVAAGVAVVAVRAGRSSHPRVEPVVALRPVLFSFESTPPGAEVRLADQGELLGLTPFRREFPRSTGTLNFKMKRVGHKTDVFALSASADAQVRRELSPEAPPAPAVELQPDPLRLSDSVAGALTPRRPSAAVVQPATQRSQVRRGAPSFTVDPFAP